MIKDALKKHGIPKEAPGLQNQAAIEPFVLPGRELVIGSQEKLAEIYGYNMSQHERQAWVR